MVKSSTASVGSQARAPRAPAGGDDRLDRIFHALSHRTRRALLAQLSAGPARVTDLARPFAMSLPTVSKHIRVLEGAALVSRAVDGRVHRCSLAAEPLRDVERWLDHYRWFWDETLESLARYAEADAELDPAAQPAPTAGRDTQD